MRDALGDGIVRRLRGFFAAAPVEGVVSVRLFGSHAEGRAHRESDVDVGVLLDRRVHPTREGRWETRVRLTAEVVDALDRNRVDLVVLNDAPPELGRRVVQEGIPVFCSDAEADHAYVRDVQLRAADLDPWLRRNRRTLLEAIRR